MNKDETLALFAQGREAWNAWANEMLGRRKEMDSVTWNNITRVDFADHSFVTTLDCSGLIFPGSSKFRNVIFHDTINFSQAKFHGITYFSGARFLKDCLFGRAHFYDYCIFNNSRFYGEAFFPVVIFDGYVNFNRTLFNNNIIFTGSKFLQNAEFCRVIFRRNTEFRNIIFRKDSLFCHNSYNTKKIPRRTIFGRSVVFDRTIFDGAARFTHALMYDRSSFRDVCFRGTVRFDHAIFKKKANASFNNSLFKMFTSFNSTIFLAESLFNAINVDQAFDIKQAQFAKVPSFFQAHFSEAPRLDDLAMPEVRGILWPLLGGINPDEETSARFRALKRLAIQAHDHTREQDYFASELKALRGHPDSFVPCPLNWLYKDESGSRLKCWQGGLRGTARYWFGLGYEILSDFGRSIIRPLIWLSVSAGGFAWVYLCQHFARAAEAGNAYSQSSVEWLGTKIASWFTGTPAADLKCLVGHEGSPLSAAIGLSIRKALPFAGVASTEKLNQIYACLYGTTSINGRTAPVIPDAVDYLGIGQLLLSLILIFLFLLAVRNHFRIR